MTTDDQFGPGFAGSRGADVVQRGPLDAIRADVGSVTWAVPKADRHAAPVSFAAGKLHGLRRNLPQDDPHPGLRAQDMRAELRGPAACHPYNRRYWSRRCTRALTVEARLRRTG